MSSKWNHAIVHTGVEQILTKCQHYTLGYSTVLILSLSFIERFSFTDPAKNKYIEYQKWLKKRLDDAIQAADKDKPKAITVVTENIKQNEKSEEKPKQIEKEEIKKEEISEKVDKPLDEPSGDPIGAVVLSKGFKPLSALALNLNGTAEKDKILGMYDLM